MDSNSTPEILQVLDLCTRKRPHTPDSPASIPASRRPPSYDSRTCQYSPVSISDSDSCETSNPPETKTTNLKSKTCRPFKAYIKDPLTLAQGVCSTETLLQDSSTAFTEFREKILSQVQVPHNGTNKNMRRVSNGGQSRSDDPTYWEKRRKNNEAAKKSRDARRAKEDELAIRCAFLERENCHLKFLTTSLKEELDQLRQYIFLKNNPDLKP